jgi:hypothetical protein
MAKNKRKKFDTGEGNLDMIKNSVTAIKHHADELTAELKKNPEIEAWVLAKVDRAAQNLSDVTHYLDGEMNKFAKGGKTPVIRAQFEEEEFEYADGGELVRYKILEKYKYGLGKIKHWKDEKLQTGGREFLTFKQAQDFKKKLQEMTSSFEYKVVKVDYADGGMMSKGGETKPSLIPDYKKISNVEVEDIDRDDYPDFSDAYISYAEYDGEPMTDEQLEELNQDGLFVYDAIHSRLFAKGGEVDYSYLKDEIERTAMRVRKGLISIGEGERKLERMESGLKSDLKEANKDKSARELEIMYNQICSKYELDFDVIEDDDYADGGKVRQNKKDKLWESIKNKFSEIFYLKETDSNEIFSNDVTAEKNEYLYFASAWVTTTLSFEEAENKFKRMLTEDEKKIIKIERNVKDINEAFGVMSEKKILVKRIDKMADGGMMARGGKVKSRWIQDALSGDKGALRKTAKRKGLIKGDEKLSKSDLRKLEKMGGKTAKRARLAETLIDFKK